MVALPQRLNSSDVRVAYLVNQYPKVSHTFIRREILALERQGVPVARFAVRGWDDKLSDPIDDAERQQTRYLLRGGILGLLVAMLRFAASHPWRFMQAVRLAWRLGQGSVRSTGLHIVYLAEACLLVTWLRDSNINHLHAHFGTNPATVACLAKALGGPGFSFTVHGPEEFDKPLFLHLPLKIRAAHRVVAISSYGRSQLMRWVPQELWSRFAVVHCGLEPTFHAVADRTPEVGRLVCVGRLCEQKGQLLLIEALARIAARGRTFHLVLAGDGELREAVESLIRQHRLENRIEITGWIGSDRVREEIQSAQALVLPSFAEGLPVVLMEAMALRRPVLSTYVAGIPELVRPGKDGWLVPAGDIDALSLALEELLDAPHAVLNRMGSSARERVLARHDIDTEARKLHTLFRQAVDAAVPAA